MVKLRVVMAGGGTGGHLYPGLAVAEALEKRVKSKGWSEKELEIIWGATGRAVDQRLLGKFGEKYVKQAVQPLSRSVVKLWGFWRAWRASVWYWEDYVRRHKVDCVVALGGYAAGPAAHVAGRHDIPLLLLNPDALPGRANRYLFKKADFVVTQWPLSVKYQSSVRGEVRVLGCPIREGLLGVGRAGSVERMGLDGGCRTLVVTGASLGAKTINDAMLSLMEDEEMRRAFENSKDDNRSTHVEGGGASRWQIVHLSGMDQAAEVKAGYAKWPGVRVKVIDYCDDMGSVWAVADLAIARAGASTCAELMACGVASILLPYPFHADMHQRANARELEHAGAAVIVEDRKEARGNAAAIKRVLETLVYDDVRRRAMAEAAQSAGRPRAAEAIAGEILTLMEPS